jgi:hypothetical protein
MALLAQVNWIWLVAYTVVDHVAFQLYKLVRGDLAYWIPGLGLPLSSLARFAVKVASDFTGQPFALVSEGVETPEASAWFGSVGMAGWVHCRHPCELGGAYFLFNAVMGQLSVFVSAYLYSQYYVPPVENRELAHHCIEQAVGPAELARVAKVD